MYCDMFYEKRGHLADLKERERVKMLVLRNPLINSSSRFMFWHLSSSIESRVELWRPPPLM